MARMSKKQYELLTEALGEALANSRKYGAMAENGTDMTILTVASYLQADNANFRYKEFVDNVRATADVQKIVDETEVDF